MSAWLVVIETEEENNNFKELSATSGYGIMIFVIDNEFM